MTKDADFADLYAAAWPRLFRTTYAVAGDLASAEDALQTAFALAYKSWRRVSGADDPIAYVRRMAINAALVDSGESREIGRPDGAVAEDFFGSTMRDGGVYVAGGMSSKLDGGENTSEVWVWTP